MVRSYFTALSPASQRNFLYSSARIILHSLRPLPIGTTRRITGRMRRRMLARITYRESASTSWEQQLRSGYNPCYLKRLLEAALLVELSLSLRSRSARPYQNTYYRKKRIGYARLLYRTLTRLTTLQEHSNLPSLVKRPISTGIRRMIRLSPGENYQYRMRGLRATRREELRTYASL